MKTIDSPQPYVENGMKTPGTSFMLIRQYQFPDEFQDHEFVLNGSTHVIEIHFANRSRDVLTRHTGNADHSQLWRWVRNPNITDEMVLSMLTELTDSIDHKITGYRVTGSVSPEGKATQDIYLFARDKNGNTVVHDKY